MDAGDGGIFKMRIFQNAMNQTGLHVHYEKYNMIDGSRTVDTQFDTLDAALEFVKGYQTPAERPGCSRTGGNVCARHGVFLPATNAIRITRRYHR